MQPRQASKQASKKDMHVKCVSVVSSGKQSIISVRQAFSESFLQQAKQQAEVASECASKRQVCKQSSEGQVMTEDT
jgi:hypothetical protein